MLVFDGTIGENIAYGQMGASEAAVERAAQAADLQALLDTLPAGLDTRVGQKGRRLSAGQRQRVAIARALLRDAPFLVLDEPTTGLDAESSHRVLAPLSRLMSGRTSIVISHSLLTTHNATQIVVVENGRIVERGNHTTLLARANRYAKLYDLQQGSPGAPLTSNGTHTLPARAG